MTNNVFVVTYQSYLYGDEYDEIKYVMQDPVDVKGVFSTKKKAERFIEEDLKKDAIDMCDDDDDDIAKFIEEYRDHYSIYKLKVDGQ